MNKEALINQLVSMRASIDACLFLLQEEEDSECQHPKEYRLDLTTMGGVESWQCKLCGYEYIAED